MAQTGFTPIQIYSSSTGGNTPAAGSLANSTLGSELAINITDGKLFYKDNTDTVQVIGWKITPTTAGGTGLTSYTAGDMLYYATGTALSKLAIGASGRYLSSSGTAPQWTAPAALTKTDDTNVTLTLGGSASTALLNAASLTLGWTGTLATTRGGTGLSSFTANGIVYASSTSALATGSSLQYDGTKVYNNLTAPPSGWTGIGTSWWVKQSGADGGFYAIASGSDAGIFMGHNGTLGKIGVSYGNTAGYTPLGFYTSDTLRWQLETGGTLTQKTASTGVNFTANSAAAGMTSQLLNYYEEGTWTPNQGSGLTVTGSFSSAGTYTRVGRMVFVSGEVSGSTSVAIPATGFICTNMPFTTAVKSLGGLNTGTLAQSGQVILYSGTSLYGTTTAAASTIYFTIVYSV